MWRPSVEVYAPFMFRKQICSKRVDSEIVFTYYFLLNITSFNIFFIKSCFFKLIKFKVISHKSYL